jgi:hypothetical protein
MSLNHGSVFFTSEKHLSKPLHFITGLVLDVIIIQACDNGAGDWCAKNVKAQTLLLIRKVK